jgi:hypothetical protein
MIILLYSLLSAPASLDGLYLGNGASELEPMQQPEEALAALQELIDAERAAYHAHNHSSFEQAAEAARARRRLRALYVAIELIKAVQ